MPKQMSMYPLIDSGPLADYTELSSKVMVCKRKYVTILFNIKEIRFGLVLVWMNQKEDHNSVKICPRCKEPNPYFSTICQKCNAPLDEKELIEAEMNTSPEKLKEIDNMANTLMSLLKSNPNLLEQLKSIKK